MNQKANDSQVWVFPDEPNPTKVKRSRSAGKKMIASFFKKPVLLCQLRLKIVIRLMLNSTQQFACRLFLKKFVKIGQDRASSCIRTTHRRTTQKKRRSFWPLTV